MKVRVIVDVDGVSKEVVAVEESEERSNEEVQPENEEADAEDRPEPPPLLWGDVDPAAFEEAERELEAFDPGRCLPINLREDDLRYLVGVLAVHKRYGLSAETESMRRRLEKEFQKALQHWYQRPRRNARRRHRRWERMWRGYGE